jgi:hypothetical protein
VSAKTLTSEEARRWFWLTGNIEPLLFHSGQLYINEMYERLPGSVIVLNVSRQFGKTSFLVGKAIATAIKNSYNRIRIGAAFETDLTEFIEPAFEWALKTCPQDLRPVYHQQKKRFTFGNGSTIKLVGLDRKPNGLRGNTIDLIGLDEAGFINRLGYLYDSVIVPLTTHRPNARIIFQSTPPESPDHEFWDFVDRAKLENSYAEFTIDENPMLGTADVERLERKLGGRDSSAFQREYLCKRIVEAERAIIPEWREEFEIDFDAGADPLIDPLYPYWHKYEALDIGVQVDKTVCLYGYYNFREATLYIMHESDISGTKTTTKLIYDTICQKEKDIGFTDPYRRIADNSHPLLLNDLSEKGMGFGATDKQKLHEMVGEVRIWVKAGRIKVHKRCKQLVGCLRSGIWNDKRTEFERSKVLGHFDAAAALIYLVRNTDVYSNPLPDYVYNPDRLPGYKRKVPLSPMGQDIKAVFSRPIR